MLLCKPLGMAHNAQRKLSLNLELARMLKLPRSPPHQISNLDVQFLVNRVLGLCQHPVTFPKPLALLEPVPHPTHEFKGVLFLLELLWSNLNMEVLCVAQAQKLIFVTSIVCMIVNMGLGKPLAASCLVRPQLEDLRKTDRSIPVKSNTTRSMVGLNALVTLKRIMERAKLSALSQLVVLAVLKVIGLIGLLALLLAVMVAQPQEPVLLHHLAYGTPTLLFAVMLCLRVVSRSRPKNVAHPRVLKIVFAVIGQFGLIA